MWETLKSLYATAITKIIEVEGLLKDKSGEEKQESVVVYLAGLFDIPGVPNFIEDPIKKAILRIIVDKLVHQLNLFHDWDFGGAELTDENTDQLAEVAAAEVPVDVVTKAMSVCKVGATLDEKLAKLYEQYNMAPAEPATEIKKPDLTQEVADAVWEKCIAQILKYEGGYADHPVDKGGPTNMGITQGALAHALAQGIVTHCDVKDLTRNEAVAIYKANYWDKYNWGSFPWPACLVLFDATVHSGPGGMARAAQNACNAMGYKPALVVDGKYGPKTLAGLTEMSKNTLDFCKLFLLYRKGFFDSIIAKNESQEVFRNGWYKRLKDLAGQCGVKSPV